jgi:hypothetical protein
MGLKDRFELMLTTCNIFNLLWIRSREGSLRSRCGFKAHPVLQTFFFSHYSSKFQGPLPSLDLAVLQGEFDRYDVLFRELQEQAQVHSTKLAKLMGKLWGGTSTTFKDLFTINKTLSADKEATLTEMKRLQSTASGAKEAYMVELDQMKLQLTVTRAALREKEGFLATEQRRALQMENELRRLRVLVGKYVEGTFEIRDGGRVGGNGNERTEEQKFTPQWMDAAATTRQADVFQLSDEVWI